MPRRILWAYGSTLLGAHAGPYTAACRVILDATSWRFWLGDEPATAEDLKTMLVPYPAAGMRCWAVSKRVGNVKNNDPSLIEPAPPAAP
jgi:putative SOS response-associated peptidase YedK